MYVCVYVCTSSDAHTLRYCKISTNCLVSRTPTNQTCIQRCTRTYLRTCTRTRRRRRRCRCRRRCRQPQPCACAHSHAHNLHTGSSALGYMSREHARAVHVCVHVWVCARESKWEREYTCMALFRRCGCMVGSGFLSFALSREFQTQLLLDFSKSFNKSNLHHWSAYVSFQNYLASVQNR